MAGAFGGLSRDGFMIEVYTQLSQLRQAHASSLDGVLDAVGALTQLAENLVSAPADERRHRVRIGNPRFFQRVGRMQVSGPGPPPRRPAPHRRQAHPECGACSGRLRPHGGHRFRDERGRRVLRG